MVVNETMYEMWTRLKKFSADSQWVFVATAMDLWYSQVVRGVSTD
jgi:hypothetical protein